MNPVYSFGCGDQNCPLCAAGIEAEIQSAHVDMVNRTMPGVAIMSEWMADAYGTGAPRGPAKIDRRFVRGDQNRAKATVRIKRVISNAQRDHFQTLIEAIKPRSEDDALDWMAELWVELLNPTVLVDKREAGMPWPKRIARADARAQDNLGRRNEEDSRYVSEDYGQA